MKREPLISTETDQLTQALLASAQNDEPSAAAYAKVAAALGVAAAPVAIASLAPAAAGAGAAASRWSLPAVLKGLGFVVASGAIIGGALLYRNERDRVSAAGQLANGGALRAPLTAQGVAAPPSDGQALRAPVVASAALVARAGEPAEDESSAAEPAQDKSSAAEPAAPPGASSPASTAAAVSDSAAVRLRPALASIAKPTSVPEATDPPKPVVTSSLQEQVMALDRVRLALSSHRPGDALREIASYRTHYPKGVFLIEASVLEIEALAASGERALAASKASAFLAAHPDSPHAARLRALVPKKE